MDEEILYESPALETEEADDEIERLKKQADTDDLAVIEMGNRYMKGDGVKQDPEEALKWYGKSRASLARYSSALIYYGRKDYSRAEKELLRSMDAEDTVDTAALPFCALMLGKLYLLDWKPEGKQAHRLAVQYLEQGLDLDPTQGDQYAGLLGMAYEELDMQFDAVHWYRTAIEEFGQRKYRERLYPIYLTGIVGAAKKREAEEAMG